MVLKNNICKMIPLLSKFYTEEDILEILMNHQYLIIQFIFAQDNKLKIYFKACDKSIPKINLSNGLSIVFNRDDIIKDTNRLRLINMSNEELSNFIFGEELDYFITKNQVDTKCKFIDWLNDKYDPNANRYIADIHIDNSKIVCMTSELYQDELRVGDIIEILNIDNNDCCYDLKIVDILQSDNRYYAKGEFVNNINIPLQSLTDILYKNFKIKYRS